ncbi:L-aminopeptidase/D-esterase-like protein [Actinomadura pelletieri DSM 43383]|uniref:L-aminopeptidase/D-esterase-like protein n=1 Tax=Actinomadura pelletieri DSM 43383 TaxID=1120940 RepID=A0A495QBE1_9ACTN|nr:P1 family peptidase [Actinomadura pelletieri]RKS69005.1 L-aminopeptidase/D-esterase-like protein [Actinomadura pelletieri DSM 43383]
MTRARTFGLPLSGIPGPHNAITDVPGVEVGYRTLISGDGPLRRGAGPVRTGVTAILPRGRTGYHDPCAAGIYSLNGNGEMTGSHWIAETGALTLPVLITNTHAVGASHRGAIDWARRERPDAQEWMLPVVAETWDGYLNDIDGDHVRPEVAVAAIDAARGGPVEEGSVGGGTGMNCYEFKGGSGTSSRTVPHGRDTYTVGAFVQANFGTRRQLTVCGVPVGVDLADDNPIADPAWLAPPGAGSVIVVIATDAPLLPGQCTALARRVPLGLALTGTYGGHGSGDIFLAFSTGNPGAISGGFPTGDPGYDALRFVPWNRIDPFYEAVVQVVEEAVLNALFAARTMVGRDGHRSPGLPQDRLKDLLTARGVL